MALRCKGAMTGRVVIIVITWGSLVLLLLWGFTGPVEFDFLDCALVTEPLADF